MLESGAEAAAVKASEADVGAFEDFVQLLTYCYVLPIICLVGVVGNLANLSTLATPKLSAVSYSFLRALAIADLACMLSTLAFCSCQIVMQLLKWPALTTSYSFNWMYAHSILPMINIPLNVGTYMVMALTLERYLSVCFPIWFRSFNSPRRAFATIGVSVFIVILLHIPQFWRGAVVCMAHCNASTWNDSIGPEYKTLHSPLYSTQLYVGYKWVRETLCKFLPIFFIGLMNVGIILAFRKHKDANKRTLSYAKFRAAANLLEIANHALNFYVFCLCSRDYRSIFMEKFPCFRGLCQRARLCHSCIRTNLRRLSVRNGSSGGAVGATGTSSGESRRAPNAPAISSPPSIIPPSKTISTPIPAPSFHLPPSSREGEEESEEDAPESSPLLHVVSDARDSLAELDSLGGTVTSLANSKTPLDVQSVPPTENTRMSVTETPMARPATLVARNGDVALLFCPEEEEIFL